MREYATESGLIGEDTSMKSPATQDRSTKGLVGACVVTSLIGASAGFALQPMMARILLPRLGGTAAVWTTSVLFFQFILLAGYGFTHWVTNRLQHRGQLIAQLAVVVAGLAFLPIRLRSLSESPSQGVPAVWLLITLLLSVGVPYFALTTTSPFVQAVFSRSRHGRAADPYFLYAVSNIGSLGGLLAYPFLIEPALGLARQRVWWSWFYVAFAVGVAALIASQWRSRDRLFFDEAGFTEPASGALTAPSADTFPGGDALEDQHLAVEEYLLVGAAALVTPGKATFAYGLANDSRTQDPLAKSLSAQSSSAPSSTAQGSSQEGSSPEGLRHQGQPSELTAAGSRQWLGWIALSAIPATISLGATSHLTTDVAPVPMIWVLTLSLYLLSYVIAFGKRKIPLRLADIAAACAVGAAVATTLFDTESIRLTAAAHLCVVFTVGLSCHGRLAAQRPPAEKLTGFYLALSVGGILGSLVNAVAAPLLLTRPIEYALALIVAVGKLGAVRSAKPVSFNQVLPIRLAAWTRAPSVRVTESARRRLTQAALALALTIAGGVGTYVFVDSFDIGTVRTVVVAAVAVGLAVAFRKQFVGAVIVGVLAFVGFRDSTTGSLLFRRSFYGAVHVDRLDGFTQLIHGTTLHGYQFVDPTKRATPTSYYGRPGPLGKAFEKLFPPSVDASYSLGVVGLGTGTIAAYAGPKDRLTYFEIDQKIVDIASDPKLFTFLSDTKAKITMVLGDGRRSLQESADTFDLLVIDAFSSDAVPTHLLTSEALALYRGRLTQDGVLAVHISNRYLDLQPLVGAMAADLNMTAITGTFVASEEDEAAGTVSSDWVFLTKSPQRLDPLRSLTDFAETTVNPNIRPWTDDRIDLRSVLIW